MRRSPDGLCRCDASSQFSIMPFLASYSLPIGSWLDSLRLAELRTKCGGRRFYERDSICFALFVESLGCDTGPVEQLILKWLWFLPDMERQLSYEGKCIRR